MVESGLEGSFVLALLMSSLAGSQAVDAREQQRIAEERQQRARAVARMGAGWKSFEIGPFLVLSEGQDALARETAADAAIFWGWLEEEFAFFAAGTRAPAPILCVHASEAGASDDGYVPGGYVFLDDELYRLAVFPAGNMQQNLRRRLAEAWFEGHDRDLWFALPGWMRLGLVEVFADARIKGGDVIFKSDTDTLNDFAAALREDRLVSTRTFLKQPLPRGASQWLGTKGHFSPSPQAGQLLRYLLAGKGAKGAKTKKIIPGYVAALRPRLAALAAEVDAALEKAGVARDDPLHPEKRALEFEKLEERTLPALFDEVFAGWTEKDWDALQEGYWYGKL